MKTRISAIACICIMAIIALAATASALPITLEQVKLDGVTLSPDQTTRLNIEKNQKYPVEILIEAHEDIKNMELKIVVTGFEYSLIERAEANIGPVNLKANEARKFKTDIMLSDNFETDNYLLRIFAMDRDNTETAGRYAIAIDSPKNSLKIKDVIFSPETKVSGKESLLTTVRIENNGDKDQKDVKVRIYIPDFDLAATAYIEEIEANKQQETKEMYIRMPKCGENGIHAVEITVEYGKGHYKTTGKTYINFEQDSSCVAPQQEIVELIISDNTQTPDNTAPAQEVKKDSTSQIRKALEILLLVLVVLLVIVGLVIGFTRLGKNKEEEY